MEITSVRVRRVGGDGKFKASASVTFDDAFVVHDFRIVEGQAGLFVSMPARKMSSGEFRDIAHPVTSEFRETVQGAVLQAYDQWAREHAEPGRAAVATV